MKMAQSMDDQELELVRSSVQNVLETAEPAAVHEALVAQGWEELLAAEPAAAIDALGRATGRLRSTAPAVSIAMSSIAGYSGQANISTILPPFTRTGTAAAAANTNGSLEINGLVWPGSENAAQYVVVTDDAVTLVDSGSVELTEVGGFDPKLGISTVTASLPPAALEVVGDAAVANDLVAVGRRVLAAQLLGAASKMLEETIEYVAAREQYGRSIGSFQSVKHRLADVHVAITAGNAALEAAWSANDGFQAIAAKALAGRAQQLASKHCQQVQGGIAFTVEHGFHDWVRRGHILDATLGRSADLTTELGRQITADGSVPRVPVLHAQ
jgi:hypothetical protein